MNGYTVEVTEQNFNEQVVKASYQKTIVVDFWAEWCAPCKMLGPILENIVRSFGGKVLLAKIDVDANQALAAQFGIRSIPSVKIIKDGAIANEFVGAQPEAQIRAMLEQIVGSGASADIEAVDALIVKKRFTEARQVCESVLADDPSNAKALIALVRIDISEGDIESARARLSSIEELSEGYAEAQQILTGLEFLSVCSAVKDTGDLEAKFAANPGDLDTAFTLGCCRVAEGRYREALEAFLAIVSKNRDYGDGKARDAMLSVFGIAGPQSDLTVEYRTKLANVLF